MTFVSDVVEMLEQLENAAGCPCEGCCIICGEFIQLDGHRRMPHADGCRLDRLLEVAREMQAKELA